MKDVPWFIPKDIIGLLQELDFAYQSDTQWFVEPRLGIKIKFEFQGASPSVVWVYNPTPPAGLPHRMKYNKTVDDFKNHMEAQGLDVTTILRERRLKALLFDE